MSIKTTQYLSMIQETVIPKLIPIFRQYGYEGTSLSMLSQASGLGKASLYHHFPQGKKSMADAVMDYITQDFNLIVLKPLREPRTPERKIQRMSQGLRKFYNDGHNNCFLAIMSLGEADKLFHDKTKRQLEVWIKMLAQVLVEAGIEPEVAQMRSQNAVIEIQGALTLVRILGDQEIFIRTVDNLAKLLLE